MTDGNTNPLQHPATPDQTLKLDANEYENFLICSGLSFERGLNWPEESPAMAAYRPTQNFLFDGLNDAQELEAAADLADMSSEEAARAIAAEMYANAIQREIATPCEAAPDRASLIAAAIMECPAKHFTTTEIARYVRITLDMPMSEREIDSVLLALKAEKQLTTRGGFWVIGGAL